MALDNKQPKMVRAVREKRKVRGALRLHPAKTGNPGQEWRVHNKLVKIKWNKGPVH